jgi:hypothetical protein
MLVSHRKNFIFTKTVKTAGTSIESYFEQWCMPDGQWHQSHAREEHVSDAGIIGKRSGTPSDSTWYNHMSAYNICKLIGPDIWNSYFKFTVVRNPFEKVVSGYYMFRKSAPIPGFLEPYIRRRLRNSDHHGLMFRATRTAEVNHFRKWLKSLARLTYKNRALLDAVEIPHYLKPIELSLIDRDKYIISGEECVDFFIRHENLYEGLRHVCNRLQIPFDLQRIPAFKRRARLHGIPLQEYFDQDSLDIVHEIYAWEIERFGYGSPTTGDAV